MADWSTAYVQKATASPASAASSCTVTPSTAFTAGNLLVACIASGHISNAPQRNYADATGMAAAGWTIGHTALTSGDCRVSIWYKTVDAGGLSSVTIPFTGSAIPRIVVYELTGGWTFEAGNRWSNTTWNADPAQSGQVTLGSGDHIVIAAFSGFSNHTTATDIYSGLWDGPNYTQSSNRFTIGQNLTSGAGSMLSSGYLSASGSGTYGTRASSPNGAGSIYAPQGAIVAFTAAPSGTDYAAAGVVAGTSAASGTVTAKLAVAGAVAAVSALSGAVTSDHAVSGTVAATSAVAGAVTSDHAASGAVAATSAVVGAVTQDQAVAGTVAATSGVVGAVTADHSVAGTVAAVSGVAGSATVDQGAANHAAAGVVAATSGVAGTVTAQHAVAGEVAATSAISGTVTADHQVAGTVAAVSGVSGSASVIGGPVDHVAAGTVAAISTVSGEVTARHQVAGTVVVVSAASGTATADYAVTGVVAAVSGVSGSASIPSPTRDVVFIAVTELPQRAVAIAELPQRAVEIEELPQ